MSQLTSDAVLTGETEVAERSPGRRIDRETVILLVGLPLFVTVLLVGWVIWYNTASLEPTARYSLRAPVLWSQTVRHVALSLTATAFVLLVSLPLGVLLTRRRVRRFAPVALAVANGGQAAPAIGLVVLLAIWLDFGFWTGVLAFTIYGILPVLRNTIVGLQGVDPTLVEAARGMGMSGRAVLFRVEVPLALPVIMSGVRTALVLVVGVAAFGTFVGAGGLGETINAGIILFQPPLLMSGALFVACLALVIEWLGRLLEAYFRPKGL